MKPIFSTEADLTRDPAAVITAARERLGHAYGLQRALRPVELARLIGLHDVHGGPFLTKIERGQATLSGPVRVCIGMLLAGHRSPRHSEALRSRHRCHQGKAAGSKQS